MNINLSELSDKDLFKLANDIKAESKAREEGRLYKRMLGLGEDRWKSYTDIFHKEYIKKGWKEMPAGATTGEPTPNPIHTIFDNMRTICDLVTGNYDVQEKRGFYKIIREGQLIQNRQTDYIRMYNELLHTIDKYLGYESNDNDPMKELEERISKVCVDEEK